MAARGGPDSRASTLIKGGLNRRLIDSDVIMLRSIDLDLSRIRIFY